MKAMKLWMRILAAMILGTVLLLTSAACTAPASGSASQAVMQTEDSQESDSPQTHAADPDRQGVNKSGKNPQEGPVLVGICLTADHKGLQDAKQGFEDTLKARMGENVSFLTESAQNDQTRYEKILGGFREKGADLILVSGTGAVRAAAAAGESTIPVVGITALDFPAALQGTAGAESRRKPGMTGVSGAVPLERQAGMFAELVPDSKKIGILYCPEEYVSSSQAQQIRRYLEDTGYRCAYYTYADAGGLESAVREAAKKSDAIYIPADHTAAANTQTIEEVCREAKTPVITAEESICAGCGEATLSPSWYELGSLAGEQAAAILCDGKDPGKMEYQYASYFRQLCAADRCRELGISVPGDYLDLDSVDH